MELQVLKARVSPSTYFWESNIENDSGFMGAFMEVICDHSELAQSMLVS